MTNYERLIQMTDEELARQIRIWGCQNCYCVGDSEKCNTSSCEEFVLKWLRKEAKEREEND